MSKHFPVCVHFIDLYCISVFFLFIYYYFGISYSYRLLLAPKSLFMSQNCTKFKLWRVKTITKTRTLNYEIIQKLKRISH